MPIEASEAVGDHLEEGEERREAASLPAAPPPLGILPPWDNPLNPNVPSSQLGPGGSVLLPHLLGLHLELSDQGVGSSGDLVPGPPLKTWDPWKAHHLRGSF